MSDFTRRRERGLTSEPFITQNVKTLNTDFPENGWSYHTADSVNPSWSVAESSASVIVDTVDSNGANAEGHYTMAQPCDHVKVVSSGFQSMPMTMYDLDPFIMGTEFIVHGPFPGGNGDFASDWFCPPPPTSVINDFSLRCLNEMTSMFPNEMDMLSFVKELKELTTIMDTLKSMGDTMDDLLRRRRPNVREAAKAFVGTEFGIYPLLDDTATIYNTFNRVAKRIEWLLSIQHKWVRVGSTTSWEYEEDIEVGAFGYSGWTPSVSLRRTARNYKLTSSARAKFTPPDIAGWLLWTRGVISDMGFDKPLSTWWEVTPFSWAVDYFADVSGYLKTKQAYADPNWEVRDPSWSFNASYGFELQVLWEGLKVGSLGRATLQRYRRLVGLPPWEWTLTAPTGRQTALLAAVALPER